MMTVYEFGERLLETEDLDPVYCGITRADEVPLAHWLISYWCFYHVGVASFHSEKEGEDYWKSMREAALNVDRRYPRASERRHFRGAKCAKAIDYLSRESPQTWINSLLQHQEGRKIMEEIQTWPMFGPWIAFKVADMLERITLATIVFDRNMGLLYKEPREALEILGDENPKESMWSIYEGLISHFSKFEAPPNMDRACGPQEVETILCKWKAYRKGHYYIGKDIKDQRAALKGWGKVAERILNSYPEEVL